MPQNYGNNESLFPLRLLNFGFTVQKLYLKQYPRTAPVNFAK